MTKIHVYFHTVYSATNIRLLFHLFKPYLQTEICLVSKKQWHCNHTKEQWNAGYANILLGCLVTLHCKKYCLLFGNKTKCTLNSFERSTASKEISPELHRLLCYFDTQDRYPCWRPNSISACCQPAFTLAVYSIRGVHFSLQAKMVHPRQYSLNREELQYDELTLGQGRVISETWEVCCWKHFVDMDSFGKYKWVSFRKSISCTPKGI